MKIRNITVRKENLGLTKPYQIAFKTINDVENGIVEIVGEKGCVGYGAFNPIPEVVGESLDQALETFTQTDADFLVGRDLNTFYQLCDDVQKIYGGSPGLRAGIEMALYDLFTQSLRIPLAQFLGQKIISMPTSVTIGIKSVEETLTEAKEYLDRGFKILKIKLGISTEEDLERLTKIREVYGYHYNIIVDVNQGYSIPDLEYFWKNTRHLDIGLIEQPIKAGMEAEVTRLPEHIRSRLAADESLINYNDALALCEGITPVGCFNIKLMKCGGITEARKIADVATVKGINLMWGCNDESRISITAALHLALACRQTRYLDLDGSLDLRHDVVGGGFELKDGIMSISERPGLGLFKN